MVFALITEDILVLRVQHWKALSVPSEPCYELLSGFVRFSNFNNLNEELFSINKGQKAIFLCLQQLIFDALVNFIAQLKI